MISNWPYFGVDWSNGYWGKFEKYFEYSKLFLQLQKSYKLFNGLDDFKVALYVCPNHIDNDIHSDHSYLDIPGIPLNSTLILLICQALDLEMFENLNGLVMEEPVYSGCDTKFYTLKNLKWTGMAFPFWVRINLICFLSEMHFPFSFTINAVVSL